MSQPVVYGDAISTYVRSVRLALAEKGVEHTLSAVDLVKGQHKEPEFIARQPFGKMPAFEHDGNAFYEVSAMLRYVDEAFEGPALMPSTPAARARINQVLSIVDSYGYGSSITELFIPRILVPMLGGETDEAVVKAAVPKAQLFVDVIEKLLGSGNFFGGDTVTLADLHLLPVLTYLSAAPEGKAILESASGLRGWLSRMSARDSAKSVMPPS